MNDEVLNSIKKNRGYSYEDEITCSKECLQNYESKVCIYKKDFLIMFIGAKIMYWNSSYSILLKLFVSIHY